MGLTTRQWAAVGALVVGFGLSAWALSTGGSSGPVPEPTATDHDEVAWCRVATAVGARASVLDPSFDGDASDASANLLIELENAIELAPAARRGDLARINDFVLLVDENLTAGSTLPDSLLQARAFVDQARLDAAVTSVGDALDACGADRLP